MCVCVCVCVCVYVCVHIIRLGKKNILLVVALVFSNCVLYKTRSEEWEMNVRALTTTFARILL